MNTAPQAPGRGARVAPLLAGITLAGAAAVAGAAAIGSENTPPLPWGIDSAAGRCVVCHSLEQGGPHRVAPNLWGIVGAEKARDRDWYGYSPGLIRKGGVWTEEDLDEFLEDASRYSPGSTKSIRVSDAQVRREIIDFLKTLR